MMNKPSYTKCLLALPLFFLSQFLYAQNNACGSAPTLTSAPTCSNTAGTIGGTATFAAATGLPGACATSNKDVWYTFTAKSVNPTITLSSVTVTNIRVQLLSGSCASMNSLFCGTTSIAATGLTIGTQYWIRIYSTTDATGGFNICITDPAPANDDCAGAILISSGATCVTTTGNMYASTNSGVAIAPCTGPVVYDMWYKFVAQTQNPTITLTAGTSITTPGIQLFDGPSCGGSSLFCGTTSISASSLVIGSTYFIRVYAAGGTAPTAPTNAGITLCVVDPPANDLWANATSITTGFTCSAGSSQLLGQTLNGASVEGAGIATSCGGSTASQDVWYKFVAQSVYPTITVSNLGASWGTRLRIQLLSGTFGSFTEVNCANNAPLTPTGGGLIIGNIYYIRILKNNTTAPTGGVAAWAFDICVTDLNPTTVPSGRMNEVYKQTILSPAGVLADPWEVTYGPDNHLWVTESKGYKAYRVDPATGARTTIIDISQGASGYLTPSEHTAFNVQFSSSQNPWPQGGFAGLVLHPKFLDPVTPKNYVYISYVRSYDSTSVTTNAGVFFTNTLVRFTYNTSTGKLESPVALCDTLPGSSDHNSQRVVIAPVGGTYYLFYAQGDMGAGQFGNQFRANKAQNTASYQGKILRFNLEDDGDAGTLDKWIPNDNPFNGAAQSAVWCKGIRNNQGFAYDATLDLLYGSSHGPFSDDEINVIERARNYGHPLVIGFAADGNCNGTTAGTGPSMSGGGGGSSCPSISVESTAAAAIGASYKDPLFSAYPNSPAFPSINNLWNTTTGANGSWPSEGWSGLDLYTNKIIPGWKRSLVAASLKWGRLVRLKLGPAGTTTLPNNNVNDTISYFGSTNRFRDLAFAPNGKDIFVIMDRSSTTSGPSAGNPIVPACGGCLLKYTFLGYNDVSGESSIPASIDVTDGTVNTCNTGTTITIDNSNNNLWVPITGPDGNIMAEIYANGNNLGTVTSSFYKNSGAIRIKNGNHYLDRNMTITPQNQPSSTVKIRLYFSKAEYDALDVDPGSGVSSINSVKILKNSDPCGSTISSATTLINPTFSEAHGANGYMLQGDINSFSSFYFSSSNVPLPLDLLTFKGSLQNNATQLEWETTNEKGTALFSVERSIDGHDFQQIGTVAAKDNSVKNKYSFWDYDATHQSSSLLYYRLKMIDKDGSFTYSDIVIITLPGITGKVSVFPNPALNQIKITISAPADGKAKWNLVDNTGRIVMQNSAQLKKGNNSLSLNIGTLSTGVYYLGVSGGGVDQKVKIEKL